jgi:hypothetical protein
MRRRIEQAQIDSILQRPGLADEGDLTSPTVVLIKDKARGDKRCWAAFLAPRLVRRRMRIFPHQDKWELRADDLPLDEAMFSIFLEEIVKLRIAPVAHEEKRTRGGSTFTLKLKLPGSHTAARFRWAGRGPDEWTVLVDWAERFRRFVDPAAAHTLETDNGRLEELERWAHELDDEFKRRSIADHVVAWRRELTRLGAVLDPSGETKQTGSHIADPIARLRKVSGQIDQLYDAMKVEEREKGGPKNWPPPPPG